MVRYVDLAPSLLPPGPAHGRTEVLLQNRRDQFRANKRDHPGAEVRTTGASGGVPRCSLRHGGAVLPFDTGPQVERHPPGGQLPPGLSPGTPGPEQQDGRPTAHAKGQVPVPQETGPAAGQPERGLPSPQHLCSRQW
ncbi:uncharacterized protein [Halyomorpha halys]|uniref:uncharacterized protein n=1 Tax=Halyomorpha halys TaxID=286706 RepID=UPI0006D525C6|nr:uncharacterized protein LOC106678669 [Halyomorpha halys]